jgi:rod shape-determining protein MreB
MDALAEPVASVIDAIHSVLEMTPPELSSDIADRGIVMTGGGCMLYGLDKLIKHRTGINAIVADDAVSCVAIGTGRYIEFATSKLGADLTRKGVSRLE